jgi:hypothetical protein
LEKIEEIEKLENEILKTEIGERVYQLYNLTPDEVQNRKNLYLI